MNQESEYGGGIHKWQRVETDALTIPDESNGEEESAAASETTSQQMGGYSLDNRRQTSLSGGQCTSMSIRSKFPLHQSLN